LIGNGGNDVLDSGTGADSLSGGAGSDRLDPVDRLWDTKDSTKVLQAKAAFQNITISLPNRSIRPLA
jgi:hypothetical protein